MAFGSITVKTSNRQTLTTCLFCCSRGQVRSSWALVYTGTKVRRDGGAHTNLTTAGSTAGKGLVRLGWFPTDSSKTFKERREMSIREHPTVLIC